MDTLKQEAMHFVTESLPQNSQHYSDLFTGFSAAIRGTIAATQNAGVVERFKAFLKPYGLFTAGMYAVLALASIFIWPIFVLFPGLLIQLLSLIPFWAYNMTKKQHPLVNQQLFMEELKTVDPKIHADVAKGFGATKGGQSWLNETIDETKRSWHFSKYSLLLTVVSAVPIIGAILSFVGQTALVADRLGWNLFDIYTQESRHMSYKEQKEWMQANKWVILGFTLPFSLVTAIPFVGPFVVGFAQASAAHLFAERLYATPTTKKAY